MRIAIFTDIYAPWSNGGIASSIRAQKEELEKLGHKVTVFCPGFDAREKGVITVPSFKHFKVNGAVMARLPEVVEAFVLEKVPDFNKFDVVHVHHEVACSVAGIRLAKKFGVPLVQTMHGREDQAIAMNVPHPWQWLVANGLGRLHRKYLPHGTRVKKDKFQAPTRTRAKMWELMVEHANQADVVTTPSDHFAKKLEHYGVERPMMVLSNGVADELVETEFQERELGDGAVLKMIWNSRLSREKRILPFLKAVAMLRRPYILYVYGTGNDEQRARRFAKRHGMKVKFYGESSRKKILTRMREVHLGIMASYNFDTQGMTLLEAEVTGLPVFFCDPEMMEVVPRESFVLSGGPEPEAMAIALEGVAPEKVKNMSRMMLRNRKEVLQSKQVKKLLAVYKEAIRVKAAEKSSKKK